jgi:ferric-dicitrate binding protein FerR (iron transport regulator)
MDEKKIERFLSNQCSKEELNEIAEWLKNKNIGLEGRIWLKKYWKSLDTNRNIPELSEEGLLDRTHHLLNLRMNAANELSGKPKEKTLIRLGRAMIKAAAILFIPLLFVSLAYYMRNRQEPVYETITEQRPIYQQIDSPMGNKTRLELSDGSIVWLNHGSSLRFPLQFSGNKRTVYLEGEAYFEIQSSTARPFVVNASDLQFMATGTKFNIMAYPDEDVVEATLEEGKIALQKVLPDRSVKNLLSLAPNQQARYIPEEKQIDYFDVDPDNYISWKEGKLVMIDDPLTSIAKKLERWYNVEIDFTQEEIGFIRYSGTFTSETLQQVLDLMKLATPIDYTLYPRERKLDGTYSLQRVVISMKKGYKISVNTKSPESS